MNLPVVGDGWVVRDKEEDEEEEGHKIRKVLDKEESSSYSPSLRFMTEGPDLPFTSPLFKTCLPVKPVPT